MGGGFRKFEMLAQDRKGHTLGFISKALNNSKGAAQQNRHWNLVPNWNAVMKSI
jgi:hypothetical protein